MKDLKDYIIESNIIPAVTKFYRANIGRISDLDDTIKIRIGDVTEISFKYHYGNKFTFGEPRGYNNWQFALDMEVNDNMSKENFDKFLAKKNKEDKFYQYFIEKADAEKAAQIAKKEYDSQKWTLETLLKAIKSDKDLMSLKYDYNITDTYQQKARNITLESIYVSSSWRIFINDNKILVERAGWHIYEVPNLQSLYIVLNANSGSDHDEAIRQQYSIVK